MKISKKKVIRLFNFKSILKSFFWFSLGALLSLFFITSTIFVVFQKVNNGRIYPGILLGGKNFGGVEKEKVKDYFQKLNDSSQNVKITFLDNGNPVTEVYAKDIDFGYNADLISTQAYLIGRSENLLTNIYLTMKAYTSGVYLPLYYSYSQNKLDNYLSDFRNNKEKKAIDALFKFENGRVILFTPSQDGLKIDDDILYRRLQDFGPKIMSQTKGNVSILIPLKVLKPTVTTEDTNNLGIKELIGLGTSHFAHSIPGRIYNITLASSKFNGILVAPDEIFSFDKILGDVSSYTGYKQAYIIQNGKTILGDGGGVCQVSTTLFRAILNAGLPVIERHAHSYRVGYYEQDMGPGFDATVYYPSVDLKFKNDTGHYILIQTQADPYNMELSFSLYGTSDGRTISISNPVITNQTSAPPDLYQDDPTLPKGEVKQVDFAANGADVYFTRVVKKDGKIMLFDKFISNFQPWQAVYLRGTG